MAKPKYDIVFMPSPDKRTLVLVTTPLILDKIQGLEGVRLEYGGDQVTASVHPLYDSNEVMDEIIALVGKDSGRIVDDDGNPVTSSADRKYPPTTAQI